MALAEQKRLRLGVIGDLHLVDDPTAVPAAWHNAYDFAGVPARVARALDHFAAADVDAVALLGDIGHDGSHASVAALGARLARFDRPVIAVTGNHDDGGSADLWSTLGGAVTLADPAGMRIAGVLVAGVHVAAGGWAPSRLEAAPALADWPDEPVVLLSHFPLLSHALRLAERGLNYPGDVLGRAAVASSLGRRRAPTIVLSGHIHARDASAAGTVLQLTQGALVEAPYECAVIDVSVGASLAVRRTVATGVGPAAHRELPVLAAPSTERIFAAGQWHAAPRGRLLEREAALVLAATG